MTHIISSVKAKTSMVTKDPLKDAAWGNVYYGVDDCIVTEVKDRTPEERAQEEADILASREAERIRNAAIDSLVANKAKIDALIAASVKP